MLVLGTDGLWVFCTPEHVAVQLLQGGVSAIHQVPHTTASPPQSIHTKNPCVCGVCVWRSFPRQVCAESRQQWADNSYNRTVDDVTAIAVAL